MKPKRVCMLMLLCVVFACGGQTSAYRAAISSAKRAESAGRLREAARSYDEASERSLKPRDRAYNSYAAATLRLRAGEREQARAALERLASDEPPNEQTPQACFLLGKLALEDRKTAEAWTRFEHLMKTYPSHGVSRSALKLTLEALDAEDASPEPGRALLWLAEFLPQIRGSELEEVVLYEQAKRFELHQPEKAESAYIGVADRFPYPHGVHFDDALYNASKLATVRKDANAALTYLRRLLAERESSHVMGTYERPKYIPAMLEIARIYEQELKDRPKAIAAWHRLYQDFTSSRERDNALANEARLQSESGDMAGACGTLNMLVREFPDSRYVPCAILQCPQLARPANSKAPKECHDYLLRRRNKEAEAKAEEP
jgi:outer membrane protein assembly factor BamD (BamD/ComL family)